jgi:hypothetical protein
MSYKMENTSGDWMFGLIQGSRYKEGLVKLELAASPLGACLTLCPQPRVAMTLSFSHSEH